MARRSSIKSDPKVQAAVDRLIKNGHIIDAIVEHLDAMGTPRSRSAVGRYVKDYAEMAQRQRDLRVTAESFAAEFGNQDDPTYKLMLQIMTQVLTEYILPHATGKAKKKLDPLGMRLLAASVKDMIGAGKLDDDRLRALKQQHMKEAASAAEKAMKRTGASADQIRVIKQEIMGIRS